MDLATVVFEKIKLACAKEHGIFHAYEGTPEHACCLELEAHGLIRRYDEDGRYWVLND